MAFDEWPLFSPTENLQVITSGALPPNPAELIASKRMKKVLADISQKSELIILDTPPIQAVTDSLSLAADADGVIVVAQPGKTHTTTAKQTVEQLRRAKAQILGVILNRLDLKRSQYAYRYAYQNGRSGYHHYYHADDVDLSSKKK
jgi:capsular exopolysaccharide synthesis family protein